jgi:hypothetical protein
MAANTTPNAPAAAPRRDFLILLACLLGIMGVLFVNSFRPEMVCFNNDGPLGANMAAQAKLPDGFTGSWATSNWLGGESSGAVNLPGVFIWLGGVLAYSKFLVPVSLIILGMSAWFFFRAIKLSPSACLLGGIAAALQSSSFAGACWGQMSGVLALAAMFLALGLMQNLSGWRGWVRMMLAGMMVGWGVIEGFDKAALFSLVVAAFVLFQAWVGNQDAAIKRLFWGGLRLFVVVVFAGFMAIQSVTGLIGTQIQGVAGMQEDKRATREHWDWATQWSLPKVEVLSFAVPGLFGYRMDTPQGLPEWLQKSYQGGQYWGKEGRDPAWDRYFAGGKQGPPPQGFMRFVGGGGYVGPLMLATALWALLQSFRKKNSPFSPLEKKFIWFWAVLGGVGVLLAFGRFAPFYQLFYALPHASTIRNPDKFSMYFQWAVLVIFTYGVHGLSQRFQASPATPTVRGKQSSPQPWWVTAAGFDKKWIVGSGVAFAICGLGWMIYAGQSKALQEYLQEVGFDAGTAVGIAAFSIGQVGWFMIFLTLALGALAFVLGGYFTGERAKFGTLLLGAILVVDLGRANLPWIIHLNWPKKYATNPVLEKLREKPYEQRVVGLPPWIPGVFQVPEQARGMEQYLDQLYRIEWSQHHFLYYDIQSLDVIQMPRPPEDMVAFQAALQVRSGETLRLQTRHWELTNTRYILALAGFVDLFNKQFDPGRERFRIAQQFNIVPKPGVTRITTLEDLTAENSTNGPYALLEFTGALPRARLYTNWQVSTNDDATLQTLASAAFDPAQTVLIAAGPAAPVIASTNQDAGTVVIKRYLPKRIELSATAAAPSILLLNDRFAAHWRVTVDGQPETLLRCNYLMRGVALPQGAHTVEFVFAPPTRFFTFSLVAIGTALLLGVCLFFSQNRLKSSPASP